jgi:hypothetical protein
VRRLQDAKEWWTIVVEATKRLLSEVENASQNVRAVTVTGQYASTVPVDANGEPTGPCVTWLDTRGGHYTREAVGGWFQGYNPRKILPFVRKTGGAPSTAGADPIGQILFHPARSARDRRSDAVVHGTHRLFDDALYRRRERHPRVAPRHVDDRQSPPR